MKADLKIKMEVNKAALRQNEGDISRVEAELELKMEVNEEECMCGESDSQPEPWAQKLMGLKAVASG